MISITFHFVETKVSFLDHHVKISNKVRNQLPSKPSETGLIVLDCSAQKVGHLLIMNDSHLTPIYYMRVSNLKVAIKKFSENSEQFSKWDAIVTKKNFMKRRLWG